MKRFLLLAIIIMKVCVVWGQTEATEATEATKSVATVDSTASITTTGASEVHDSLTSPSQETVQLLPRHMMFTQRILWGERGLMRNFKTFELSEAGRDREMDIRNKMLVAHEYLGYATLASLAGECVVGIMLYNGKNVSGLHEGLAGFTNTCYFSTAALALFAPPRLKDRPSGWSYAKIHKALAIVHFTGMIATNILAGLAEDNHKMVKYHRAAAIATFASYFAATIVIKLK